GGPGTQRGSPWRRTAPGPGQGTPWTRRTTRPPCAGSGCRLSRAASFRRLERPVALSLPHQVDGAADRGGLGRGEVGVEGREETFTRFRKIPVGKPDRLPRRLRDGRDDSLGRRLDPGVVHWKAGQLVEARVELIGPVGGPRIGVQRPGEDV